MQAGPDRLKATLAGCAAILLWAFLALLTRAASVLPPLELSALAFTVSAVFGLGVAQAPQTSQNIAEVHSKLMIGRLQGQATPQQSLGSRRVAETGERETQ